MFTNITNEAFVKQRQQILMCITCMDNILIHLSECWWGGKGLIAEYNEAIICFVAVDIIEYHCFIQSLRIQKDKCKKVGCELQDDNLNFETFGTPHFNKNNLTPFIRVPFRARRQITQMDRSWSWKMPLEMEVAPRYQLLEHFFFLGTQPSRIYSVLNSGIYPYWHRVKDWYWTG